MPNIPLVVVPPGATTVVLAQTPPELLSLVSPVVPVETPVIVPEQTPIVVPPAQTPPMIYVVPPGPRKQGRN